MQRSRRCWAAIFASSVAGYCSELRGGVSTGDVETVARDDDEH